MAARATQGRGGRARGWVARSELLVVAVLALGFLSLLVHTARQHSLAEHAHVRVTLASDPAGSAVLIDGVLRGRTPLTLELARGVEFALTVIAPEPYREYSLFEPYRGVLVLEEDANLAVWVPRTSAEEQARQRAAAP